MVRPVLSLDTSDSRGSAKKPTSEDNLFERPDRGESSVSDFANNHEGQYQHVDQSDPRRKKEGKGRQGSPPQPSSENELTHEDTDYAHFEPSSSGNRLTLTGVLLFWTVLIHCLRINR